MPGVVVNSFAVQRSELYVIVVQIPGQQHAAIDDVERHQRQPAGRRHRLTTEPDQCAVRRVQAHLQLDACSSPEQAIHIAT